MVGALGLGLRLEIVMGNPGVFQGYPYPYPDKPIPINKGTGFCGLGCRFSGFSGYACGLQVPKKYVLLMKVGYTRTKCYNPMSIK